MLYAWAPGVDSFELPKEAGLPAEKWSQELAQAARLSVGMVDGYLAVPQFPFAAEAGVPR